MDLVFLMFTNGLVLRKSTGNHRFSCFFPLKYGCSRVFLQNFLQPILSFRFFHSSLQVASLIATLLQGKLIKLGWVATCRRQIPTESCDLNCSLEGIPWDTFAHRTCVRFPMDKEYNQPFLKFPAPLDDSLRCQMPKQLAFFSSKLHHDGGSASPFTHHQWSTCSLTAVRHSFLPGWAQNCWCSVTVISVFCSATQSSVGITWHYGITCCSVTFCLLSCGTRNHARIHFNLQP